MAMHDEARKKMAQEDIDLIDQYTNDWNKAYAAGDKAGMDKAHQLAEGVRYKYSYTGGDDGSLYQSWGQPKTDGWAVDASGQKAGQTATQSTGKFSYPAMSEFTDGYQKLIDAAQAKYLNREAFSYDAEKDPSYRQYRDSYTRQGQKAMQDTLAEISARTGGLASSYAGQAAQQTYDGYMSALADKIPELREIAYQKYMDQYNMDRDKLNVLTGLSDREYNRYRDARSDYDTDRNFEYNRWYGDRDYNYKVGQDAITNDQWERQFAHQKEQADIANNFAAQQQKWREDVDQRDYDYTVQQDALDRDEAAKRLSPGAPDLRRDDSDKRPDEIQTQAQKMLESGENKYNVLNWLYNNADDDTIDRYVAALGLEEAEQRYRDHIMADRKIQVGTGGGPSTPPIYTKM